MKSLDSPVFIGANALGLEEYILIEMLKANRVARPTASPEEIMNQAAEDKEAFVLWGIRHGLY